MKGIRRSLIFPALVASLFTVGGCGVELVGGAQRGEVETVVVDDPPEGSRSSSRSPSFTKSSFAEGGAVEYGEPSAALAALLPTGTVTADLSVALVTEGGEVVDVAGRSSSGPLRLASSDTARIGVERVGRGSYPRVRVTFTRVEAMLSSPLATGVGLPVEGRVTVDLSTGPLIIEVPVTVPVIENDRTTIVVNLGASTWLLQASPLGKTVSPAAFRAAVKVRVK